MAKQKGWKDGGWGSCGRQYIRRMSVNAALENEKDGGKIVVNPKTGSCEVWDKEGYCVGYLTSPQVVTISQRK